MAVKMNVISSDLIKMKRVKKRTSVGNSVRSSPKNKSKKRNWKQYRGQGK
jgi:hypothetical protein